LLIKQINTAKTLKDELDKIIVAIHKEKAKKGDREKRIVHLERNILRILRKRKETVLVVTNVNNEEIPVTVKGKNVGHHTFKCSNGNFVACLRPRSIVRIVQTEIV